MAYAGKQSSQLIMSKPLEPRIAVRLGPALPYTTQPCRPRCSLAQRRDGDLIVDSSYRGRRDGKGTPGGGVGATAIALIGNEARWTLGPRATAARRAAVRPWKRPGGPHCAALTAPWRISMPPV